MPTTLPLTIEETAAAYRAGTLTAVQVTTAILDRAARLQERLGAYITLSRDSALAAAVAADDRFARGVDDGPLQGIPLAVKDIIATADAPTTANSRVLDPAWGRGVDAPVVARLRAAGAVILGKTTAHEFACGEPDPSKGFPIPHNPWNVEHTSSGSSSGTAVAVAAGLALGGLGTDTGGSIRSPAAANGHTGLCVTHGRVPRTGVVPLADSMDSVGPMARSAYDCAVLLGAMAGHHPDDRSAARAAVPDYTAALTGSVDGVRIGVAREFLLDNPGLDPEVGDAVLAAVALLRDAGASTQDVVIPHLGLATSASLVTISAEAFAHHRTTLATRWYDYGCFTRPLLVRGALLSSGDHIRAQRVRTLFAGAVGWLLDEVDVVVTPTLPAPAERMADVDIDRPFVGRNSTRPWNFAGLPAAAVPCGFSASGLPLSMQIVGRPFAEATVLAVADAYQRLTDWHLRVPPAAGDAAGRAAPVAAR